jgi:hypothetical protein
MKKFSMFVIAALCAISLSSCGDDSSSSSNNANPGASASPSASLSPSASASADGSSYDTAIQLTTDSKDRTVTTSGSDTYFYVEATSSTRYIFKDSAFDSSFLGLVSIRIQDSNHNNVETSVDRTITAAGITGTTTTAQKYYFVVTGKVKGNYALYLQNK